MSAIYEAHVQEELVAEQEVVQAGKFQGRMLREYNHYIFSGQEYLKPLSSSVTDLMRPLCDGEYVSLEGVLEGLHSKQGGDRLIHWVDMGGGRGLSIRQVGALPELQAKVCTTNVDLFDFGFDGLDEEEMAYLENIQPGMTSEQTAPQLILDNVESVTLPQPADLITSVEGIQYLNNPLAALSNWYNQLQNNGLLVVAAEHDWPSWIRYQRNPSDPEYNETPTKHILEELGRAGINFAVTDGPDWVSGRQVLNPNQFRILAIQKMAGTVMTLNTKVDCVWVNPYQYKAVYYEAPDIEDKQIVDIATI